MAKKKRAEAALYDLNGGYKNPSPDMKLAIKLSRIDTSWFNFEEHGLYRKGGHFDNNKKEKDEPTRREQNVQTVQVPVGDGADGTTRGFTLDGEGTKLS
jgi:hypothetical protein